MTQNQLAERVQQEPFFLSSSTYKVPIALIESVHFIRQQDLLGHDCCNQYVPSQIPKTCLVPNESLHFSLIIWDYYSGMRTLHYYVDKVLDCPVDEVSK